MLQALAQKLHRGCTDLASVQAMLLDTYDGDQRYEACPKYMASLFYVLAHMSGLRVLQLWIYSMQLLPPLSGLEELLIHFNTPATAEGVVIEPDSLRSLLGCLHELSSLKKLSLIASPCDPNYAWVDQWAPPLLLGTLHKLTSLSLFCFAPVGITLPHDCKLDLRLCESASIMEVGRWRAVQCNLGHLSLQDRVKDMAMTPDLLYQDLPSLDYCHVQCSDCR